MKKCTLPNLLSVLRMLGTAALLFAEPFTIAFFVLYSLCGLTDVLDGTIARATHTTSDLGAKLDSAADLLFYAVLLVRIFPALWQRLPRTVWLLVGAALLVRVASYTLVAVRDHSFASLHTVLNKLTGLMVFAVPYLLISPAAVPGCFATAAMAVVSSADELVLHLKEGKTPAH